MSVSPREHKTVVYNHEEIPPPVNESENLSVALKSESENYVKKEVLDQEYNVRYDGIKRENRIDLMELSEYENKYDAHIKKEIHDEDYTQPCKNVKKSESIPIITTKSMEDIILEQELCMSIDYENETKYCPVSVKIEILPSPEVLYDSGDTGTHYDILVAPRKIICKLCHQIFEDSFNLYKHNIKHLHIKIETTGNNLFNKSHQCQCCNRIFENDNKMFAHMTNVHGMVKVKCEMCCDKQLGNQIKHKHPIHNNTLNDVNEYNSINRMHNMKHLGHGLDDDSKYKCDSCEKAFISQRNLSLHIRRIHRDYGRTFDCWCGKQFSSPYRLMKHKYASHERNNTTEACTYECELCKRTFKNKTNLQAHIKRLHYDYKRMFNCVCGQQFTTPHGLYNHRYRSHGRIRKTTSDTYECDLCKKIFKNKQSLKAHIKIVHHDNGISYDCWCGEQFASPYKLKYHRYMSHNRKTETVIGKYKCDLCKKIFKSKVTLAIHIQRLHCDYGRTFDCWCGKKFPSPVHLGEHKCRKHTADDKNRQECSSCKKVFTTKRYLLSHIQRVHVDYGKTFDCWCGKQFRTPPYLRSHVRSVHGGTDKNDDMHNV